MIRSFAKYLSFPVKKFDRIFVRSYISMDLVFGDETIVLNAANSKPVKNFLAYPISQNINGKFRSIWCNESNKSLTDVVRYFFHPAKPKLNLSNVENSEQLLKHVIVNRDKVRNETSSHVTWLGHATCYYQTEGAYFLTDPVWSERCSPLSFMGPKRYISMPIEIEDLKIDVVLLSHTHYDHLDIPSAMRIGNRALW
jgi:hypothetical protein